MTQSKFEQLISEALAEVYRILKLGGQDNIQINTFL